MAALLPKRMADHYRHDDADHHDYDHDHADDDGSLEMILVIVFVCSSL